MHGSRRHRPQRRTWGCSLNRQSKDQSKDRAKTRPKRRATSAARVKNPLVKRQDQEPASAARARTSTEAEQEGQSRNADDRDGDGKIIRDEHDGVEVRRKLFRRSAECRVKKSVRRTLALTVACLPVAMKVRYKQFAW